MTLAVFKYFDAWFYTLNLILHGLHMDFRLHALSLVLPLGISFYIFQTASYLIDVYREKCEAEKNILKYALFASYFPQMIQGPINRYGELQNQLTGGNSFDAENIRNGILLMIWGMLKKAFIADTIAPGIDAIYSNYMYFSGVIVFFGVVLFCIQLYCDFSGGIDIVRGASRLFGVEMAENFKRPYFSASIDEFWRRWHLSLGEWMKDYLFYPLALSKWLNKLSRKFRKKVSARTGKLIVPCSATIVVFLAVGIWQGPGFSNIAYGLWNGLLMSGAMFCKPYFRKMKETLHIEKDDKGFHVFQIIRTCFLVTIGRYFSRSASFLASLGMLKHTLLNFTTGLSLQAFTGFGITKNGYIADIM